MAKFKPIYSGEDGWSDWQMPVMQGYRMGCCDCNLVHTMEFKIEGDRVLFRARRNNRSTSALRRNIKSNGLGCLPA